MPNYLPQTALPDMIRLLCRQGVVYAPKHSADGIDRFTQLDAGEVPDLALIRTLLPPKKYLLHPCETILNFSPESGYHEPEETVAPWFLLGVHPCDLAAIAWLDTLLLEDQTDTLYARRRNSLTLIGVSCEPDSYCSCEDQISNLPASCDLFLLAEKDGWLVTAHSDRGAAILNQLKPLLQRKKCTAAADTRRNYPQQQTLPQEPDWQHPGWQALAEKCLACGACSVTCPTCSCFDIKEQGGLEDVTIERIRSWDNCLRAGHSRVAGSFSFLQNRRERFQYRYRHKYLGFSRLRGVVSCTGCGRCRAFCPAHLDLRELERELRGGRRP